jgi:hypothetical protein
MRQHTPQNGQRSEMWDQRKSRAPSKRQIQKI